MKSKKKHYGHSSYVVVNEASSGEESCIESTGAKSIPSIYDVCKEIADPNTIRVVRNKSLIPKEAKIYLIFTCLEPSYNSYTLKSFIEDLEIFKDLQVNTVIQEIRIIKLNNITFGLVNFLKEKDAEVIRGYFSHPKKLANPTINSSNKEMRVFWAYDILDLKYSEWYGIVIRGLPLKVNENTLRNFCANQLRSKEEVTNLTKHIKFVHPPVKIKNTMCSIVQTTSLDLCERLCLELNKKTFSSSSSQTLKAHLHPKCCRLRFNHSNRLKFQFKDNRSMFVKPVLLENNKILYDETKVFIEEITLDELSLKIDSYYKSISKSQQMPILSEAPITAIQPEVESVNTSLQVSNVKEQDLVVTQSNNTFSNNHKKSPEYSFAELFGNNQKDNSPVKQIPEKIQKEEVTIQQDTKKDEVFKSMLEFMKESLKKTINEKAESFSKSTYIANSETEFSMDCLENSEDCKVILENKIKSWEVKFPDVVLLKENLVKDFQCKVLNIPKSNKNSEIIIDNLTNNINNNGSKYSQSHDFNSFANMNQNGGINTMINNSSFISSNLMQNPSMQSNLSASYLQNSINNLNFNYSKMQDSSFLNPYNNPSQNGSMFYSNLIQNSNIQSMFTNTYQNINKNENSKDVLNTLIRGKPNQLNGSNLETSANNQSINDKQKDSLLNKKRDNMGAKEKTNTYISNDKVNASNGESKYKNNSSTIPKEGLDKK